jgi:hypothetical protein
MAVRCAGQRPAHPDRRLRRDAQADGARSASAEDVLLRLPLVAALCRWRRARAARLAGAARCCSPASSPRAAGPGATSGRCCAPMRWQRAGFRCAHRRWRPVRGLTPRVRAELIEPLCVSALNTPAARSSGAVFLRVLRDALFGRGHGRLGRLQPAAAARRPGRSFPTRPWPGCRRGAEVRTGHTGADAVASHRCRAGGRWRAISTPWCWPAPVGRGPAGARRAAFRQTLGRAPRRCDHEAIATVYAPASAAGCPCWRCAAARRAGAVRVRPRQLGGPHGPAGAGRQRQRGRPRDAGNRCWRRPPATGLDALQHRCRRWSKSAPPSPARPRWRRPPAFRSPPGSLASGDYPTGPTPPRSRARCVSGLAVAAGLGRHHDRRCDYLDFDYSEDTEGLGTFDAMASTSARRKLHEVHRRDRRRCWPGRRRSFPAMRAVRSTTARAWDFDLQLSGTADFCAALREHFALD